MPHSPKEDDTDLDPVVPVEVGEDDDTTAGITRTPKNQVKKQIRFGATDIRYHFVTTILMLAAKPTRPTKNNKNDKNKL